MSLLLCRCFQNPATGDEIYGDINSGNRLKVNGCATGWRCPTPGSTSIPARAKRAPRFLKLNSAGQVPTVEFDDGRALAQSNAIIRYLARGSDLIPAMRLRRRRWTNGCSGNNTATSPMSRCAAYQMVYLGKPASDLDPDKIKRGYAALARMEHQLAATPFLVGDAVSLADVALLAYTRLAHEGGFHLDGYAAVRRWIGETEQSLGLAPAR